jgi:hypothetical protein
MNDRARILLTLTLAIIMTGLGHAFLSRQSAAATRYFFKR